jgi:hypothetical protein
MIRGVDLFIPRGQVDTIWQVLKCIDIKQYDWYNLKDQAEVWPYPDSENGIFFDRDYYDGKSFLQKICQQHYTIFVKLQAYYKNGSFFNIHTWEEFIESDCQLLLLICDSDYVEVYVKQESEAMAIHANAVSEGYSNVSYITDDNAYRTRMDVR